MLAQPRETLIARTIGSLMGIIACLLAVYPFINNRNKAYETDPDLRDALYALLGFLIYNTIRVAVDVADKSLPEFIRMTIGVTELHFATRMHIHTYIYVLGTEFLLDNYKVVGTAGNERGAAGRKRVVLAVICRLDAGGKRGGLYRVFCHRYIGVD